MKFGDPNHPWKATTEHCTKAAKMNFKSPWRKGMGPLSKRGSSPEFVPGRKKAPANG